MIDDAGSPVHAMRRASRGSRLLASRCTAALTLGAWLVAVGAWWAPGSHAVAAAVDFAFWSDAHPAFKSVGVVGSACGLRNRLIASPQ